MAKLKDLKWKYERGTVGRGRSTMGMINATGCTSVWGSTYPFNPYPFPWTNHLFQDPASLAMGVYEGHMVKMVDGFKAIRMAEMELEGSYDPAQHDEFFTYFDWKQFSDEEWRLCPPVVSVGGDGAMYDIGFQNLSRLMASGKPVRVLVLAKGDKEKEASDAGADFVGPSYVEQIKGGWLDFERPLVELEQKIRELRDFANGERQDFREELRRLVFRQPLEVAQHEDRPLLGAERVEHAFAFHRGRGLFVDDIDFGFRRFNDSGALDVASFQEKIVNRLVDDHRQRHGEPQQQDDDERAPQPGIPATTNDSAFSPPGNSDPGERQHRHDRFQHPPLADVQQHLLNAQRQRGAKHDPGEAFDQVVDWVQHLAGRQGDAHSGRLQRKLGALHGRDHAVQGARDRKSHERTFQGGVGITFARRIDNAAKSQRCRYHSYEAPEDFSFLHQRFGCWALPAL